MNILIIDVECTCDESPSLPRDEVEIIEIGAVIGSIHKDSFSVVEQKQIYVKPQINQALSKFCTELTGISQSQVDEGCDLRSALTTLKDWLALHRVVAWTSWGRFDETQFRLETEVKNISNPLANIQHLNLKQLFARKYNHRVGLARAVQMSGLTFYGRHHSGLDDALNIAQVLSHDGNLREALLQRLP